MDQLLHIPSCYLGIAQAARDCTVDFAKIIILTVLPGTIDDSLHLQCSKISGKMESLLLFLQDVFSMEYNWGINPYTGCTNME